MSTRRRALGAMRAGGTARQSRREGGDEEVAHCRDRVREVTLGSDGRRRGVDNLAEAQSARGGRNIVSRGESPPVRRSRWHVAHLPTTAAPTTPASLNAMTSNRTSGLRVGGREPQHIAVSRSAATRCSLRNRSGGFAASSEFILHPGVSRRKPLATFQVSRDASGWSDVAGWILHPLESAAFSRRTPKTDIGLVS
jgi:hypothetical protein